MHQHSDNKQNGPQIGPQMDPKWTQHGHNTDTTWTTPNGPQNGPQMDPKWTPNGPQMDPKWTPHGPQMDPKWTPNGPQMDPKWTPNGPQMDPKWTPNGPKMDPRGDTHISAPGAWHTHKRGSPNMATALHQPDDVQTSTSPQIYNHSWSCSCRTSIGGCHFHTKWVIANSFEVIPCKAIETFYHLDFFPWDCAAWKIRRRIWLCHFRTFIDIVGGNCTCVLSLPTISNNSLHTLFYGVSFTISIFAPKILISNILLDTSLHHSFQSVIIRSQLLLMSLQVIQFQYGLEFLRL